jgi:hypothetical protein
MRLELASNANGLGELESEPMFLPITNSHYISMFFSLLKNIMLNKVQTQNICLNNMLNHYLF